MIGPARVVERENAAPAAYLPAKASNGAVCRENTAGRPRAGARLGINVLEAAGRAAPGALAGWLLQTCHSIQSLDDRLFRRVDGVRRRLAPLSVFRALFLHGRARADCAKL